MAFGLGAFSKLTNLLSSPQTSELPIDSLPMWRIWMASESLPTLVAGVKLGLFDYLKSGGKTESEIREALKLSARAAKVLLWHSASLGLLEHDRSRYSYTL